MPPAQNQDGVSVLEILLSEKKISREDYDRVKLAFVTTGKDAVMGLVEAGKITEEDVVQARAKFYNVPFVKLTDQATSPVAMSYVDQVIAKRFKVMPLDYKPETKELMLAMANPVDLAAIEFIEKKSGIRVKPFAAMPKEVDEAIDKRYEQSLSTEVTAALKETGADQATEIKTVDIRRVGELIKEAPIAKIVTTILEFAMKSRSSDVHIEPLEGRTRVRYRID
ncbi:MAG: hypothetical protein AAB697_02845, partial [Patescibacteria group bacterium]